MISTALSALRLWDVGIQDLWWSLWSAYGQWLIQANRPNLSGWTSDTTNLGDSGRHCKLFEHAAYTEEYLGELLPVSSSTFARDYLNRVGACVGRVWIEVVLMLS